VPKVPFREDDRKWEAKQVDFKQGQSLADFTGTEALCRSPHAFKMRDEASQFGGLTDDKKMALRTHSPTQKFL